MARREQDGPLLPKKNPRNRCNGFGRVYELTALSGLNSPDTLFALQIFEVRGLSTMQHDNPALRPIRFIDDAEAVADALDAVDELATHPVVGEVSREIAALARDAASNPDQHNLSQQ